jgi:uncharacterized membrane-anchored protein
MENISWTDYMRNKEVSEKGKEEVNILKTVKRGKANLICHRLHWNCILKHFTEGKIRRKHASDGKKRKKR